MPGGAALAAKSKEAVMGNTVGITDMEKAAREFDSLSPAMLELLERQTTGFLVALWKAQGKCKKIIDTDIPHENGRLTPHTHP